MIRQLASVFHWMKHVVLIFWVIWLNQQISHQILNCTEIFITWDTMLSHILMILIEDI